MGFFVLIFGKSWLVNGIPTNADSVTIGIHDDTAGLQAVPSGTAMQNPSAGQYSYDLDTALREHAYTATILVVYDGQDYSFSETAAAHPHHAEPESHIGHHVGHAAHELNRAILENAAGAMNVTSAAGSVTAHPLDKQILAADRQAAIEARRRGSTGFATFRIVGGSR